MALKNIYIFPVLLLVLVSTSISFAQKKKKDKGKSDKNKSELSEKDRINFENYFFEGNKYYIVENYEKSLDNFSKAFNINPKSAATNYKIADLYLFLNKPDEALPFALKSVELIDTNEYYYLTLAEVYQKQNKLDESAKVLQKMMKKIPNSMNHLENLVGIYLYQNKLDDALKAMDKMEEVFGFSEEISFQRQQIYLKQNKMEEAFNEAKKLIANFPDNLGYESNLAQLYFSNDKLVEAEKVCQEVLKKDAKQPQAHLILSDIYKSKKENEKSKYHIRQAFLNPDFNIDGKMAILVSYIRMLPNSELYPFVVELATITTEVNKGDAKSFSVMGDIYTIGGEKEKARKAYYEAVKLDNSHFKIWQQLLFLDSELDDNKSLIKDTEKALEVFPNQAIFWYFNGMANYLEKNNESAAEALEQGIKISPKDDINGLMQFHSVLGDVYNTLKNHSKSDNSYEFVLKNDSTSEHVLNNYSYFLSLRKEKLDLAKYLSGKLIEKYPNNSTYLDTHAWVLYVMKDYEGAKKYLEMAIQYNPSGTIMEHYADVLYQLNDKTKAVEYWLEAKKLGGASDLIDKKIADKKLYE